MKFKKIFKKFATDVAGSYIQGKVTEHTLATEAESGSTQDAAREQIIYEIRMFKLEMEKAHGIDNLWILDALMEKLQAN